MHSQSGDDTTLLGRGFARPESMARVEGSLWCNQWLCVHGQCEPEDIKCGFTWRRMDSARSTCSDRLNMNEYLSGFYLRYVEWMGQELSYLMTTSGHGIDDDDYIRQNLRCFFFFKSSFFSCHTPIKFFLVQWNIVDILSNTSMTDRPFQILKTDRWIGFDLPDQLGFGSFLFLDFQWYHETFTFWLQNQKYFFETLTNWFLIYSFLLFCALL